MSESNVLELLSRGRKSLAFVDACSQNLSLLENQLQEAKIEYDSALKDMSLLEDVFTAMKRLSEIVSDRHIRQIESLVSSVLELVFFDKDYRFSIDISEKRDSKSADFYLVETIEGEEYKTLVKTSRMSGGVLSVIGFVLQVYFIQFLRLSPIVFIDEGFAAISDEYLPRWFDFLKRIKENLGFAVILISHDERFIEKADKVYLVKEGEFLENGVA